MPDDWGWFWASEYGRDRMLRDEVEGLQHQASAASAQSARLSSQLRTLQGSIESRLQALSTAFDAYVELGDVREQLAGFPDTGAVRRATLRALDVLGQGGAPDHVDGEGVDYWLADAVNETIDLAGSAAAGTDGVAVAGHEHETFVVAALGWLGHGDRVAHRVPALLMGDGALAAPQVVLWRATVHGVYGEPLTDVLDEVRRRWLTDLDLSASTWDVVARDVARATGPVGTLHWIEDALLGRWSPVPRADAAPADDRSGLRHLVDALVGGAGLGEERALLERARLLRARIEDPVGSRSGSEAEPPRTPVTTALREALVDVDVPAGIRQALVGWARPGLQAAAAQIAATVAAEHPVPTTVRTEVGDIEVGTEGADPQRLAELDAYASQRWSTPRSRLLVPGVAGAAVLLVALALLPTRLSGLAVVLLVAAGVLAVVVGRRLLGARQTRADLAAVRGRTSQRVAEGQATAAAVRSASSQTKAEVAGLARSIADTGAPETAAPETAAPETAAPETALR